MAKPAAGGSNTSRPTPTPQAGATPTPRPASGRPAPASQQQMSFGDLVKLARRAGATPAEAYTMAGIALAESGGRVGATSNVPRAGDVGNGHGLWQIDKRYHQFDRQRALSDPAYNAQLAVKIMRDSKSAGKDPFKPWAAYNSGAYKVHLPKGGPVTAPAAAAAPAGAGNPGQAASSGSGGLKGILDMGTSFIGTPYVWGGNQPGGFDCSGLLQYIFAQNGVTIPRVSADQARAGVGVGAGDAQAGDLIAFDNSSARPGVDHIGIYLGNGLMLQAPRKGKNVEVVKVDLGSAAAIRRIPQLNTNGLVRQGNQFIYPARAGQGATKPTSISAQNGGGDLGSSDAAGGYDPSSMLGPDGKVDPAKAIETYGYIAELANSIPDIKKTLEAAIKGGWSATRFQAELQKTAWWRTTSEAQRANEVLKKTNPGEYRTRRQAMIDKINVMSRRLGAAEGTQRVFILAERFLAMGTTDGEIERLIAADVRVAPTAKPGAVGPDGKPVPAAKPNTGEAAVTVDAIRERARRQRVNMSDATLQQWVSAIMRGDQSMQAFDSFLLVEAKKNNPDIPASAFERGETVDSFLTKRDAAVADLEAASKRFLVPMSKQALAKWASQIVAGDVTPESFDSYLKEQAKSLFPTLSGAIDRGVTVDQYAEPYRQVAAQTLEINPDEVDFSNPVYGKALLQVDPKTGERTSMGLSQFQEYLRGTPEWRKTRQANEQAASLTERILRDFGAVA